MFTKILTEERPDYVLVCFDKGRVTFRTEQFQDYKGHRKATPPELRPQFPIIKKILTAMNVAFVEMEGYEADDLIGTMVQKGEEAGLNNLILTGDKDALQLVSEKSSVFLMRRGISDLEKYDPQAVYDRYGLKPKQIIDLKGLMGDASDNIPGVPGIGEKTALKLLHQYQTVEGIYEHLDEVSPKLGTKLRENKALADLSKKLATIECCVPMEIDFSSYKNEAPDYEKLLNLYKELEFKSLMKGILDHMAVSQKTMPFVDDEEKEKTNIIQLTDIDEVLKIFNDLDKSSPIAIYVTHRGNYFGADISSVSFTATGHDIYTVFEDGIGKEDMFAALKMIFEDKYPEKIVYNAKELQVMLAQKGIRIKGVISDVMLGAYLLNPGASEYSLESLCLEFLNKALVTKEDEIEDHARRAKTIRELNNIIEKKIREQGMEDLYREVELPLEKVLAEMEITGVKVEAEKLKVMSEELEEAISKVSEEIFRLAGEEFNINSPKQLGVILFEKLELPPLKKTKTGYSTNAEVLEKLAEQHEIAAKIIEHRTLVKLKSTYVDGMQTLINPETGKLHTSFNQTVTATGRLSSTEPNLQNIPVRMELGRRIRKVFVPREKDGLLLAGDYSQIELRVLAHISGDPVLKEAFIENQDIHTRTASEVFGVPMDQVDSEMRRRAKAVNFGIVYGISDFGLSRDLGITRKEAKLYIDSYFARYQGVADYLNRAVAEAKNTGYVTTMLNRRRYLPDIFSSNYNVRSFGERTAMNTPIQGSAADIIKVAMVQVFHLLEDKGYRSKMILQVHDELIFDVVPEELETLAKEIKTLMENAVALDVPLKVDLKWGKDWYQMKEYQIES
jgi:DNA polymerase-1